MHINNIIVISLAKDESGLKALLARNISIDIKSCTAQIEQQQFTFPCPMTAAGILAALGYFEAAEFLRLKAYANIGWIIQGASLGGHDDYTKLLQEILRLNQKNQKLSIAILADPNKFLHHLAEAASINEQRETVHFLHKQYPNLLYLRDRKLLEKAQNIFNIKREFHVETHEACLLFEGQQLLIGLSCERTVCQFSSYTKTIILEYLLELKFELLTKLCLLFKMSKDIDALSIACFLTLKLSRNKQEKIERFLTGLDQIVAALPEALKGPALNYASNIDNKLPYPMFFSTADAETLRRQAYLLEKIAQAKIGGIWRRGPYSTVIGRFKQFDSLLAYATLLLKDPKISLQIETDVHSHSMGDPNYLLTVDFLQTAKETSAICTTQTLN